MFDILVSYLKAGKNGVEKELEAWESTIEVLNDKKTMDKIKSIRERIAKSTPHA